MENDQGYKMKRLTAIILAAVILIMLFASCGTNGDENLHTVYFKDIEKHNEVTAVFYNNNSKDTKEIKMNAVDDDEDGYTYSCKGDTSLYDTVQFSYEGIETTKVAFNKCVSGWYNTEHGFLPFAYGADDPYKSRNNNSFVPADTFVYKNDMYDDVTLNFNGYDKVVHIWTPEDYDPSSSEKYATVYLLDGQQMIYLGFSGETLLNSEHADVQVQSMTAATGYKAIVVAIDTFGDAKRRYSRLDEMVPDLGDLAYKEDTKKFGTLLSAFIADTVVPYVQKHYNVYTDAQHTSIAGKSLGGLEAFYITMEHPELFGTAGVLSPSFMLYNDDVWRKYLGKKSFDEKSPFLYFYCGNGEEDNGDTADEMVARIKDMGYPEDRFTYHRAEIGGHEVSFWRSIFSEFLDAMVYQN